MQSRAALEEQLRLGQQLRQKITLEKGSGDEDDSEDEDGEGK
jgi:U3 small nucleolar RNA-associated protein 14